jgi:hypothetical protein
LLRLRCKVYEQIAADPGRPDQRMVIGRGRLVELVPTVEGSTSFQCGGSIIVGPFGSGVTELDAAEDGLVNMEFDAVTVKVYEMPFVRPEIVVLVGAGFPDTIVWAPPGELVTV